jgi:hypothetical protein
VSTGCGSPGGGPVALHVVRHGDFHDGVDPG